MNCNEARRQLPAPSEAPGPELLAHVSSCDPCRAEIEAIAEVDRRVLRLGAFRKVKLPELLVGLDQSLIAWEPARRPKRRAPIRLAIGMLLCGVLLGCLGLLLRH